MFIFCQIMLFIESTLIIGFGSGLLCLFKSLCLPTLMANNFNQKYYQDEAAGFNALTIYVLVCMIFIAMAMMYYGLILFSMRKVLKIEDAAENYSNKKDIQVSNRVVKCDRFVFVSYVISFILFNSCYFMSYFPVNCPKDQDLVPKFWGRDWDLDHFCS